MKPYLLALLLLSGCASTTHLPNGCLVDAIAHKTAMDAKASLASGTWNEILFVTGGAYGDGVTSPGHVYNVFLWPPGGNTLWAYDRRGSQRVRAYISDPNMIARKLIPPGVKGAYYATAP